MSESKAVCGVCGEPMPPGEEMFNYHGYSGPCPKPPKPTVHPKPTKPGFYWALWTSPARDTHEKADLIFPAPSWEIVEVWENYVGEPCEADRSVKFGVSVPGVRESQWLENFQWGERVADRKV